MANKVAVGLALIFYSAFAFGSESLEGIFGPEFTFTFNGEITYEKRAELTRHMHRHLVTGQIGAAKFTEHSGEFFSPNGWSFDVSQDPGVVEITMPPMKISKYRQFKSDIQDAIFASAAAVGLFPWDFVGGGHLNMHTLIFGDNLPLARNFIVDYFNHNELAMGIMSYDATNAAPFGVFDRETVKRIREVIAKVDAGEYEKSEHGIESFYKELDNVIGNGHTLWGRQIGRNVAINLPLPRMEFRAVRPQANMDVWINQIQLIESRINYLNRLKGPLALRMKVPLIANPNFDEADPNSHRYTPPIDPIKALQAFHIYVKESGLEWRDHREYIWPAWRRDGTLERYETSKQFRTLESCEPRITHAI